MTKAWKGFWSGHSKPSQLGGGIYGVIGSATASFTFTDEDFKRLDDRLGLKFSCKTIATEVNKILAQHGNCYKVTCDETSSDSHEIPAGVVIDEIFK